MTSPPIAVESLCKHFGNVQAVDDVSFSVKKGEILGLLGPNGAGKTTIIHMLLGLVLPTSGSARLFGEEVAFARQKLLGRVNFSSAYVALPSNLTVRENLLVFARMYSVRRPERRIDELLERFEIGQLAHRVSGSLSSGQQARLSLCKSLLNEPEILFLDEPTSGLDPDIADKVRRTLREIQRERGLAMIYTSHNMPEVELMCDRIIFLSRGTIVMEGTTSELLERAQQASLEEVFIKVARDGQIRDVASEPSPSGDQA
ncbi:putative ABC transporter ATP-binding protein YbhF [Planctomycetes bacterium Pan216]|uniref:Putative ABC transporter ATP-binding protein YbhF n=1 Tax=Kolteria novifilia TaxID=2527975 RepID=A0A518BBF6_9BACT|nr:putative ABC transporter ATP-binding protein YbhF [Planctomycetes bacterium Pan216]